MVGWVKQAIFYSFMRQYLEMFANLSCESLIVTLDIISHRFRLSLDFFPRRGPSYMHGCRA